MFKFLGKSTVQLFVDRLNFTHRNKAQTGRGI